MGKSTTGPRETIICYNNRQLSKFLVSVKNNNIIKKKKQKQKLTDAAVPPFKARRACASIVIYTIYACSIV